MLTAKRLYLYAVLGISLVLSLLGITELLRIAFENIGEAMGARSFVGDDLAAADLSWALALVVVAVPIWAVHMALVRRSLHGPSTEVADERACASRATYFLLVLAGAGIAAVMNLIDVSQQLLSMVTLDERPWGLAGSLAGSIVVGTAWLLHLRARAVDLRMAPARIAGDWATRIYVYGALFLFAILTAVGVGNLLVVFARMLLDLEPAWQSSTWWQEELVFPLGLTIVAAPTWLAHWLVAGRLVHAAPPAGVAHRDSRFRSAYYLAVVATAAATTLVLVAMGLRHAFAAAIGAWGSIEGSRLVEDAGGPLLLALPFVVTWWWHQRRGVTEAAVFGGDERERSMRRAGRLVVAFIGLAGLSVGVAWELQAVLDSVADPGQAPLFSSGYFEEAATAALATAIVGLALWTPAWALSQRDRAHDIAAAATAMARRTYLFLVSGVAVVALMGSLAFIVYQASRVMLGTQLVDDASWAPAVLMVSGVVLGYHLHCLRSDLAVSAALEVPPEADTERVIETIEISAPAGSDFKVLNAAIRTELPPGYDLRVIHST